MMYGAKSLPHKRPADAYYSYYKTRKLKTRNIPELRNFFRDINGTVVRQAGGEAETRKRNTTA